MWKAPALRLESVGLLAVASGAGLRLRDVEHDDEVRGHARGRGLVDGADHLDAEPADDALVHERRRQEAVGHDPLTRGQRGRDDLGARAARGRPP